MVSVLNALLENPEFLEGRHWRKQSFAANEVVFSEGDGGHDIFLILGGAVRVVGSVDLDEQRRIRPGFSELGQGELFGELALFDDAPRSATVVTTTESELAVIDGKALLDFLDGHPQIGYPIFKELISILVVRLRRANQKIFSLFAWGIKSRGIDEHL